jgi:cyclopropane-fatty-acyl-phospholipid synthase
VFDSEELKMIKSFQLQKSKLLDSLFQEYEGSRFGIRFWDGWQWYSHGNEGPACTIVLESPSALGALITHPNEVTLGEAFIHGDLNVDGDIFSVFPITDYILRRPRQWKQRIQENMAGFFFDLGRYLKNGFLHSQQRDHFSISYHYDQSVEFYRPWLGKTLAYSCAYFGSKSDSLDQAQEQKLELICRKLRLHPGERFLDIGCGWGSLILQAAAKYKVFAHGITLSKEQAEVAQRRIQQVGLENSCTVELQDYRDQLVFQTYDKIASIGMVEHVGLKNLPLYFRIARRLLKPGGVFLNHGIVRAHNSPTPRSSFIDKYVFPDGHLVTLSQAVQCAESVGLEVRDVENLREHYELTLRRWVEELRHNADIVRKYVSEGTYRIWLLYMAGSAAAFHRGDIAVYQTLLSAPEKGRSHLPLRREDWYLSDQPDREIEAHQKQAETLQSVFSRK